MATKLDFEGIQSELQRFQKSLDAMRAQGVPPSREDELRLFQLRIQASAILDAVQKSERETFENFRPKPVITETRPADSQVEKLRGFSPAPNPDREPRTEKDLERMGILRRDDGR